MGRILIAAVVGLCSCSLATAESERHDGTWWHSAQRDERTGFLAGYTDCAAYEAGHLRLARVPWDLVEVKVSAFYKGHASSASRPAASVFMELAEKEPLQTDRGRGERYEGKHGIFDGEYWRQSSRLHRLGFVQGFITCMRKEGKQPLKFSKRAEYYAEQVSAWYGVKSADPSEINEERVALKIADAILRMKN